MVFDEVSRSIIKMLIRVICIFICIFILFNAIFNGEIYEIDDILIRYIILYAIFTCSGIICCKHFFMTSFFWFLAFYFLYQTVYPIIIFWGNISYYSVSQTSVTYTFLFSLKALCVILISFYLFIEKLDFPYTFEMISERVGKDVNNGFLLIVVLNLIIEIYSFITGGTLAFILSGSKTRIDINNYISTTNIWGFVGYINLYLFILITIQYRKYKKTSGFFLAISEMFFYIIVSLLTGSRKFVLYLMVVIILFYFVGIFESKVPILFGVFIILLASYQRIVVFDGGLYGNTYRRLAGLLGEFIFPTITFPLCYQKRVDINYFNYPTYLDSFLYFIPRRIFEGKNYSIATVFSRYMNVGMGFSANPLLEGYINCGKYGWIVEAIIIVLILILISHFSRRNFVLFVFGIIFMIDLNRGETSYFFRQIIEISLSVSIANRLSSKFQIFYKK